MDDSRADEVAAALFVDPTGLSASGKNFRESPIGWLLISLVVWAHTSRTIKASVNKPTCSKVDRFAIWRLILHAEHVGVEQQLMSLLF